jgi:hypothetical protein
MASLNVMPAKAGIHAIVESEKLLNLRLRGMTARTADLI